MLPLRDNAPKGADPIVTVLLMSSCVLVFLWQLAYPGGFEQSLLDWGEVPTRILAGENVPGTGISAYWTWLTSMFMHGGLMHLLGNMLMLWLFGDNVEWLLGRFRFLLFYLSCGLLANAVTTYAGYESNMPGIGASGAIAGVMAAYMVMYPRARITSLLFIFPLSIMHFGTGQIGFVRRNISALWYVGGWLVWELLNGGLLVSSGEHGNFGTYAHLSGAAFGAGLVWALVIHHRRPHAEHPVVSDALTAAVWGDEGDGGDTHSTNTLDDELARLRGDAPARPIEDFHAEELLERGERAAALKHCEEMLAISHRLGEQDRASGYEALIAEIRNTPARSNVGI